ncbi:MAG: peptidoglycan DD-metalloendopeptidase family protein [Chitinophagaceae bacterium]
MITTATPLMELLSLHAPDFKSVVPFDDKKDGLLLLDFTEANTLLLPEIVNDTTAFSNYITGHLQQASALYGIGGYNELRSVYARSNVFDGADEPRRLHLGIDIWGAAGTPVFAPLDGIVHSFAFNGHFGDYGATIILQHQLEGIIFHTLCGHLSLASIGCLAIGEPIDAGVQIATFGIPEENGHWPPHLHFQLVIDMLGMMGDYPGVCKYSEREKWLANSPDPELVLNMMKYGRKG